MTIKKCNWCNKVKPYDKKNYGIGSNDMCNECYNYDKE